MDVPVGERLIPTSGGSDWAAMPALTDLFPWQQPGVKYNRTWPISPSAETLRARWETLLAQTDATERARYFVTGTSGRNIHTKVGDYDRLSELPRGAASESLVRYGYRSFDRQWTFEDPRLAKTESPSLWTSRSGGQLYFSTMTTRSLGEGPGLTVTTAPPDLHHFRGSFGGKDVVPLYRDSQTAAPNLSDGLLDLLSTRYGRSVTPADLAAYVYLLLAQPGYVERFRTELKDPGPRVPLTAEAGLFDLVAERGRQLLWLHTYGERFVEPVKGRTNSLPRLANLNWHKAVQAIPVDMQEIRYDRQTRVLSVGSGQIGGVEPEVYDYTTSGFPVVQRWLGSRTAKGIGRAASQAYATPLDLIRPRHWEDEWNDELLDLLTVLTHTVRMQPEQLGLLESVLAADLIPADDLPIPNAAARRPPR